MLLDQDLRYFFETNNVKHIGYSRSLVSPLVNLSTLTQGKHGYFPYENESEYINRLFRNGADEYTRSAKKIFLQSFDENETIHPIKLFKFDLACYVKLSAHSKLDTKKIAEEIWVNDLDVGCYSDDDADSDDEAAIQQHGVDSVVEFYEHQATTLEYYFRKDTHLNHVIPSSFPRIRINNKIHEKVIKILRDQYANNAYCEILSERWDDECENEFNQLLQLSDHM